MCSHTSWSFKEMLALLTAPPSAGGREPSDNGGVRKSTSKSNVNKILWWCHNRAEERLSSHRLCPEGGGCLVRSEGFSTTCLEWGWSGWAVAEGVHKVHTVPDSAPPLPPSFPSSSFPCVEAGPHQTQAWRALEIALRRLWRTMAIYSHSSSSGSRLILLALLGLCVALTRTGTVLLLPCSRQPTPNSIMLDSGGENAC